MTTRKLNGPLGGDYQTDGSGNAVPLNQVPLERMDNVSDVAERQGRLRLVGFDDFADRSNGALAGQKPVLGDAWQITGDNLPTVTDGRVHTAAATGGYLFAAYDPVPTMIGAAFSFDGSGTGSALGLVFSRDGSGGGVNLTDNLLHLIVSPIEYVLTTRQDGGSFPVVAAGAWDSALLLDGTVYQIGLSYKNDVATIFGPNGEVISARDPRITAALAGYDGTVYWQPITESGTEGYVHRTYVFSETAHGWSALSDYMTNLAASGREVGGKGQVIGSKHKLGEVMIGTDPDGVFATLWFGPQEIRTTLMAPMGVSDTEFDCDQVIPGSSSVVIGSGDGAETLTTSGYPAGSSPPFTVSTSGGATKAHDAGDPVIATITQRVKIYLNPANGVLTFPSPFWIEGNDMYMRSDLSVNLTSPSADVLGLGDGDSFNLQGTYNGGNLRMRGSYLWVDATGDLRIKSSAPSSDTDGTVVGTQS